MTMSYSTHPTLLALSRPWLKQGNGLSSVMLSMVCLLSGAKYGLLELVRRGNGDGGVGGGRLEEVRYV